MQFKTLSALTIGAAIAVAGVQAYSNDDFDSELVTRGFEDTETELWARQYQPQSAGFPLRSGSGYQSYPGTPQSASWPQSPATPQSPNSPFGGSFNQQRLRQAAVRAPAMATAGGPAPVELRKITDPIKAQSLKTNSMEQVVCFHNGQVNRMIFNKGKLVYHPKQKAARVIIGDKAPAAKGKKAPIKKAAPPKGKKAAEKPPVCLTWTVDAQTADMLRKVNTARKNLIAGRPLNSPAPGRQAFAAGAAYPQAPASPRRF